MSTKKVLVSCTVISIKDPRFVYPCCKLCLSRSTQECDFRSRCIKCGFTCDLKDVDYRYRLSLKVSRGRNIFSVTVFGSCLNSFFGISAGDLQSFDFGNLEGQHNLQQLLFKAVEDCFIGRSFVFGFKLSALDVERFLSEHTSSEGFGPASAQFVACQIISPNGVYFGMTVFSYLQRLLQASSHPVSSVSHFCQSQQKDSLVDSCENTLPLCVRSYSLSCSPGLTQLWQPTSDMVLYCSTEESSGYPLQQMMEDDVKSVLSPGPKPEPECPTKDVSLLCESSVDQVQRTGFQYVPGTCHTTSTSKDFEYFGTQSRASSSGELSSVVSPLAHKLDSPVAMASSVSDETLNTMACGDQLKRSCYYWSYWSLQALPGAEHNTASFQKPLYSHLGQNTSLALEDAPLSETLGSFVSIEPQISEAAKMNVFKSATKERDAATPKNVDHVLTPLHNITNMIRGKGSEKSQKRVHLKRKILSLPKPCLTGTPKVLQVPKDSSLNIKDMVSNSLTMNPVNCSSCSCYQRNKDNLPAVHAVCSESQNQGMKKQGLCNAQEDKYNCSEDLFYQSSADISVPDVNVVTDCDESFHFAPSLQSTPIAYPYRHWYERGRKLSNKCSDSPCSKKQMACTSIGDVTNNSNTSQGTEAVKPELNQIQKPLKKKCSTRVSHMQGNVEQQCEELVLSTNNNEWSRDLFSNSF